MSNEENKSNEQTKSINPLLDEVRAERQILEKVRDEAKLQADRLEKLKSDHLLSSVAGINQPKENKPETPKEYRKRIMQEVAQGKYDRK